MMREIHECKAEVFRRSEKRIQEHRKARKRILTLCIPLCLFVMAWSVMILPAMMPAKEANDNAAEEWVQESTNGSYVCSYTEVEIHDANDFANGPQTITDKAEVTRIFSAIHSLCSDADGDAPETAAGENDMQTGEAEDKLTQSVLEAADCLIIFRTEEGLETIYTLDGNKLYNTEENINITLTDLQAASLKETLGISE
ncbi:MAG: hypothetical protein IJ439_03000 [Tyzzerella sp.]|nr:hypothetical protein [Tyzzerella sp.]